MTCENGTFYRIEESPEASPFELSNYKFYKSELFCGEKFKVTFKVKIYYVISSKIFASILIFIICKKFLNSLY